MLCCERCGHTMHVMVCLCCNDSNYSSLIIAYMMYITHALRSERPNACLRLALGAVASFHLLHQKACPPPLRATRIEHTHASTNLHRDRRTFACKECRMITIWRSWPWMTPSSSLTQEEHGFLRMRNASSIRSRDFRVTGML